MYSKIFSVKQWLSDEEFKRLSLFCKYLGRDSSGSNFIIDIEKAKRNKIRAKEIIEMLEQLGVKFNADEVEKLEELLPSYDIEFFYDKEEKVLKFKSRLSIYTLFPELKDKGTKLGKVVSYSRKDKAFKVLPYKYYEIKRLFESRGLIVKPINLFNEFEFKFSGSLRPYQEEAVKVWIEKGYNGVIALPTGAGKTIVGIKAIEVVRLPTLIVAYTKEQMHQWRDSIIKFSNERPEIGLYYSEEKKIRPITITTYQTAYKHIAELGDKFDLLIIDEVHHLPADSFKKIALGSIATKRLGLSATPYREDNRHEELFEYMGGLIYYKSAEELINEGYLARYEIKQVVVELTLEEKKKYLELLKSFRKLSKNKKVSELLELAKKGDNEAVEALKLYNEIKKLVNTSKSKLEAISEILRNESGKKILIFTQYLEQAEEISRRFNCLLLTGKHSERERKKILEIFKNQKAGALVLTTVGDEGLDIPDASVGIIVTGTGSRRQFIQRLGRLLRPSSSNKKAILYEIIVRGTSEEYQARRRKEESLSLLYTSSDEDLV
ncbi:MAG: DEAD/DEAH box helicase [Sulfolobaceae archaeon]